MTNCAVNLLFSLLKTLFHLSRQIIAKVNDTSIRIRNCAEGTKLQKFMPLLVFSMASLGESY